MARGRSAWTRYPGEFESERAPGRRWGRPRRRDRVERACPIVQG
ncbi:hypothetical protein [Halalkalicoccus salilacus]